VIRRLLITAAVAIGVSGLLPAAPAQALNQCAAGYYCAWYWYADPAHTQLNGYYTDNTSCGGGILRWGVLQGYMVFQSGPCLGGPD
jgi:hypothetical protein